MFDFFKDIMLEMKGVDTEALHEEMIQEKEEKKKKYFILSKGIKGIIYAFGILYLILSLSSLILLKQSGRVEIYYMILTLISSSIVIACLICISVKNKKAEIAGLILIGIFFIIQYGFILRL